MVPERLADAISEILNFPRFMWMANRQLGRQVSLIARLKHMKQTIELLVKANGTTLHHALAALLQERPLASYAKNASIEAD